MARLAAAMAAIVALVGCTAVPATPGLPAVVEDAAPGPVTAVAKSGDEEMVASCENRDERRSDGGPTRVQVIAPFTIVTFRHDEGVTSCVGVTVDGGVEWCSSRVIPLDVTSEELSRRGAALTFCESDSSVDGFAGVIPPAGARWVLVEATDGWAAYPQRAAAEDLPMHVRVGPGPDAFRVLSVTDDGEVLADMTVTPYAAG